jgi:hypothetical protein
LLCFTEQGYLPPGTYEMTIEELKNSILVKGDETTYLWNEPWRRWLVENLEMLVQPLWLLGFNHVFLDGSFCTDKEQPQDIDAYFELDMNVSLRSEALEQVFILAHELNSMTDYPAPVWNWWQRRPDSEGNLKCEMWHHFRIEIFPNCYGVYAFELEDGNIVKFDHLFRYDRYGIEKGVVKLIKG